MSEDLTASLDVRLFGPFEVSLNGQPLPRLRSRKGPLAPYPLALRHGREVERACLAGTLWPRVRGEPPWPTCAAASRTSAALSVPKPSDSAPPRPDPRPRPHRCPRGRARLRPGPRPG